MSQHSTGMFVRPFLSRPELLIVLSLTPHAYALSKLEASSNQHNLDVIIKRLLSSVTSEG